MGCQALEIANLNAYMGRRLDKTMRKYVNFEAFRKDTEKALSELQTKYGVEIKAGNIRYDETSFTMQLKATRADVDVQKQEFMNGLIYMKTNGFTADDYLATFEDKGKTYTIIGFKPTNKYDVIVEADNGKNYCFRSSFVISLLRK
jgi:hypothetical protein